jgi:hypothetical protein
MFVHQKWTESRLELRDEIFEEDDDYVTLGPEFAEFLWQPDPYFLNSKVAGKLNLDGKHYKNQHKKTKLMLQKNQKCIQF